MKYVPSRWLRYAPTCSRVRLWRALLLCAVAALSVSARADAPPVPLTVVRQVRLLTPEQASEKRPVKIRGVVTALSGWKTSFFLQDSSAGISVDRINPFPAVHPGDTVVLSGYTGPGAFAPVLLAEQIEIVHAGKRPRARVVEASQLAGGVQDSQWLAVRGVIRSAEIRSVWGRDALTASLDVGDGITVAVRVHDFTPADAARLIGARVTVSGVCGTIFNDRRQFLGLRMFVANANDIHIDRSAPAQPFREAPFRRIDDLLRFAGAATPAGEMRTAGVATWVKDKAGLFLQNGAQGVFVRSRLASPAVLGKSLEVVGSPMLENGTPVLQAASMRVNGMATSVKPAAITAGEMITENDGFVSAPFASVLVRVDGTLMESFAGVHEDTLLLQSGETLFSARVPRGQKVMTWDVGSELRITGVCEVGNADARESASIQIEARGPEDIVILHNAPWWTAGHAVWVVVFLLLIIASMLGWMLFVRWQATLKTQATTDSLTGVMNRRSFLAQAQRQRELAIQTGKDFHLVFIDVNRFKEMNDQFGHREGDSALRDIAAMLRDSFRKNDAVGRMGGDEFAMATVGASETFLKGRIRDALQALNQAQRPFPVSLSIGVLTCDASSATASLEDLLERADRLMYEEKRAAKAARTMLCQPLATV